MPKVFIHGNPETTAIWDDLVAELALRGVTDVVRLSPPGFGAPVPAGFGATAEEYRHWLVGALEDLDDPIDVVAHDWGAGHLFGALSLRPDVVRSWAADCAGLLHPAYEWHDAAVAWQTPEVGEQVVAAMAAMGPDLLAPGLVAGGMTEAAAAASAEAFNDDMGRCVLTLYRSAAQPAMVDLGAALMAHPPTGGLVIVAPEDTYAGDTSLMLEVAERLGARTVELADCGHWWMMQRPDLAADALVAHWQAVTSGS